ncbi:SagB/ThcOx family dehydrogenase [Aestuariivirga sp.]|uniref:SagB/ThcOx family dehydrogenase n=1 Tax=Aestuariivirga sp. TaxID=2650926 RepID=UPI0039193EC9
MSTLSKLALGMMGRLRAEPAKGTATPHTALPPPQVTGGMPLLDAISARRSGREFSERRLSSEALSNLLWAAWGTNRPDGHRTAPSALNAQEIDLYVALPEGAYLYDHASHALNLVAGQDVRRVTGYQDFVDEAPLDLIFVANHRRMGMVPAENRPLFAATCAGAIAQNVYLFAASAGLSTVIRAWIDRRAIADALGLDHDQQVLLSQTVGYRK